MNASALCTSHKWTIIIYVLLIEIDSWHHFKCHAIQQECSCGLSDHSMYPFTVYCHVLTHWQNTISLYKCTLAPQWHNAANQTLSFINFRLQLKTHYIAFSTYKHKIFQSFVQSCIPFIWIPELCLQHCRSAGVEMISKVQCCF